MMKIRLSLLVRATWRLHWYAPRPAHRQRPVARQFRLELLPARFLLPERRQGKSDAGRAQPHGNLGRGTIQLAARTGLEAFPKISARHTCDAGHAGASGTSGAPRMPRY